MAEKKELTRQSGRKESESRSSRVAAPKVLAGPCPRSERHQNTHIYRTAGRSRYCKCNDCGHTWKLTGPYADSLREYCATLAESLERASRVEHRGDQVILIDDKTARKIIKELKELIS